MLHLNDHLYTKLMCLFVGSEFLMSHCRLRTPRNFYGLTPLELCLTTLPGLSSEGCLSLPTIAQHKFSLPLYSTVRLYWTLSHFTKPTQSNTKRIVDYNHAPTPIQCDVLVHMQCNAPLRVISCPMYNECYMDNIIHTTH